MLVKLYDNNPNENEVATVVDCLENGGIVIIPTDTIYSMVCKLSNRRGFETLCKIKGITVKSSDFSILCSSISVISKYTRNITNHTFRLLRRNLPGAFTFILEANHDIPKLLGVRRKTIGVRIPDNSIFEAIASRIDEPLIGTSIHDDDDIIEYTTDPSLIYEKYEDKVEMVVDGGYGNNVASTVVDCTTDDPEIFRQGIGELLL